MVDMFVFGDAGDVLFGSQRSALRLHDLILSAREIRSQVRPNARLCHQHKLALKNTQVHIVKPVLALCVPGCHTVYLHLYKQTYPKRYPKGLSLCSIYVL